MEDAPDYPETVTTVEGEPLYPDSVTIEGWSEPRAMASWRYAYDSGLLHYLDMIVDDGADTMTFHVVSPLLDLDRRVWLDICEPDAGHNRYIRHPGRRALAAEFHEALSIPF